MRVEAEARGDGVPAVAVARLHLGLVLGAGFEAVDEVGDALRQPLPLVHVDDDVAPLVGAEHAAAVADHRDSAAVVVAAGALVVRVRAEVVSEHHVCVVVLKQKYTKLSLEIFLQFLILTVSLKGRFLIVNH